jgi:hypothetical protein
MPKKPHDNVLNKFRRFFFSHAEKKTLTDLANALKPYRPVTADPATFVVDGILGDELASILFVFLLLVIEKKLNKRIKVIVVSQEFKHRYLKASKIYAEFFETQFLSFNKPLFNQLNGSRSKYEQAKKNVKLPGDLLTLLIDGINMGPNIYSSYVRNNLTGTVSTIDAAVRFEIEAGVRNLEMAQKVLREYNPDGLLLTHSEYHTFGSLFKSFLRAHKPVVHMCPYSVGRVIGKIFRSLQGYEQNPKNYVFSVSDELFATTKAHFSEQQRVEIAGYLNSRYSGNDPNFNGDYHKTTLRFQNEELKKKLGIKDQRKVALIAAHLLWDDSTTSYHSLYPDYELWLKATLQTIRNNKRMYWVLKAHPSEYHMGTNRFVKDIVRETLGAKLPDNIIFIDGNEDINTFSLLDMADVVVTVRGTIGLEAACKRKPVIMGGSGPYSNLGFTEEFKTNAEFEDFLLTLNGDNLPVLSAAQVNDALIACYAYFFLKPPACNAISKGKYIVDYKMTRPSDIYDDKTLNRFASAIVAGNECDLV